jgi:hypothetical protein
MRAETKSPGGKMQSKKKLPKLLKWTEPTAVHFHYKPQALQDLAKNRMLLIIVAIIVLVVGVVMWGWRNYELYAVFLVVVSIAFIREFISRVNPRPCSIASDGIRRFGLRNTIQAAEFWKWDAIGKFRLVLITASNREYWVLEVLDMGGNVLDQFGLGKRFNHDLFEQWVEYSEIPFERAKDTRLV